MGCWCTYVCTCLSTGLQTCLINSLASLDYPGYANRCHKVYEADAYSKESCCRSVISAVENWLHIVESTCNPTDRAVCKAISSRFVHQFFQLKELKAYLLENETIENFSVGRSVFNAVTAELISVGMQGSKRKHGYKVANLCIFDTTV